MGNQEREIKVYNFTQKELNPAGKGEVISYARREIDIYEQAANEILEKASVEPSPKIKELEKTLVTHFSERWQHYGMSAPLPDYRIFYIPQDRAEAVKMAVGHNLISRGTTSGFGYSVTVYLYQGMTDLELARFLTHELDHMYCYRNYRVEIREGDDDIVVGNYRAGAALASPKGKFGRILEEGSAESETIRFFNEVLAKEFPGGFSRYLSDRENFMKKYSLQSGMRDLLFYGYNKQSGSRKMGGTPYAFEVQIVRFLEGELTDGRDLILRARVRGNYMSLAKAFESRFGEKAFRILMNNSGDRDFMSKLLSFLREKDPLIREDLKKRLLGWKKM